MIHQRPDTPAWSLIRHYIGRLASWMKSANFVVSMGQSCLLLRLPYEVCMVKPLMAIPCTSKMSAAGFHDLMDRVLSPYNAEQWSRFLSSDYPMLADQVMERLTNANFKPAIHAEVAILDHFHYYRLSFVNRDRYIGCSKPSCYCCGTYMSFHPLRPKLRPCHNNVWIKWSPPLFPGYGQGRMPIGVKKALENMSDQIERDIMRHVTSGAVQLHRRRALDSITDLSNSLPTIHSR